jgi:phytoene desaturase
MPSKKVVVIGAGIAGIAASIRLAVKGYEVTVFEANSYPGGKLSEIAFDGFRFDAGPSLFTMPQYVEELFELAGKNPREHFGYQKLDVSCRYFYADGKQLTAYAHPEKFAAETESMVKGSTGPLKKFAENSAAIYGITNHVFLESSLHRPQTYFKRATLKSVFKLAGIDAFRTMHQANNSFFQEDHLVQFYDRYATYNGSDPYQAPATLNVIPHLEQHYGTYFPAGGMYSITTSLVALSSSLGVQFKYNSPVEKIILQGKKAVAVRVNDTEIDAGIIVSNADVWFTYHRLLKDHPGLFPRKILQQERSSSALIFYWGIKKKFPKLDLHNIFFSADYKAEFDAIWKQKTICSDPTVYVNISSKLKPDDAPLGCENWFVMINTPSNEGQDWDRLIAEAKKNILAKLSSVLDEDINNLIVCEQTLDPRGIESKTSSYQGSLYGNSSNSRFAAFLRHANKSSKIRNLYFCGGSVHPGGGIPLALLSAKIVSDWVSIG